MHCGGTKLKVHNAHWNLEMPSIEIPTGYYEPKFHKSEKLLMVKRIVFLVRVGELRNLIC